MSRRSAVPAPRRSAVTTLVAALALTGASGALAACTSGPSAKDAAGAFATAVQSGSVQGVAFSGDAAGAAKAATALLKSFGSVHPTVTVDSVSEDGDKATGALTYSWTLLPGTPAWRYTTQLPLTKGADGWQVGWSPATVVAGAKAGDTVAVTRTQGKRGDILAGDGQPIVAERDVLRVGIDKANADTAALPAAAAALATLLGIDAAAYTKAVAAAGPQAFVEGLVVRASDTATVTRVSAGLGAIKGAVALKDTLPLAPTRDFARPLLGTVGEATAEIVQASKGAVAGGDEVGLSGLQKDHDATLRGTAGVTVRSTDSAGARRILHEIKPTDGKPLQTTLSLTEQAKAEAVLAAVQPASAIVAVQPSTGKVLAAASGPGGQGYSTATLGQYAPGSTFKIVSALALLDAGVKPTDPASCMPTLTVDGKSFKNYDAYPADKLGTVPLRTAFAESCNTAMIALRAKATAQGLVDAARSVGLVGQPDLGFPAYLGSVKTTTDDVEHAADMIGQGTVTASPLGMATAVASIVRGSTVTPQLVVGADPTATASATPSATASAGAAPAIAQAPAVRELMRAVTTEGSGRLLASLPGAPVLSKTGTAEFGTAVPPETHAWMVASQGDLAVATFVDLGDGGAKTAGPLLKAFLQP